MAVIIGPSGGNECCICGGLGKHDETNSYRSGCIQKCQKSQNTAFDDSDNAPGKSTCIPRCCPCPFMEGETLDVDFIFSGCYSDRTIPWSQTIQLTTGMGIPSCRDGTPLTHDGGCGAIPCYADPGGSVGDKFVDNAAHPYEKYAGSGTLCTDGFAGAGCSGKNIGVTLCCCDGISNQDSYQDTTIWKDCNICNYKLTVNFQPISGRPSDMCYCPIDPYGDDQHFIIPGNGNGPGAGLACTDLGLNLLSGTCATGAGSEFGDNFVLHFVRTDLWWNCDCCLGGNGDSDNQVSITATVTKT